jgi:IPT/TIG domain.
MRVLSLLQFILPISLLIFSCEDPNYPENIWDEDDQGNASPSISSVEPEEAAFAGIDTLTINGQNFSENASANLVYFNNMLGEVISATSTSLKVVTPNL